MSGSERKSKKERQAVRKAQNERYRAGKEAAGLRQVTVWVPAEALEQVSDWRKVGVVVADGECQGMVVKASKRGRGFRFEVVQRQGQLLEKE